MVAAGAVEGSQAAAVLALAGDVEAAAVWADEAMASPAQAGTTPASLRVRVDPRVFRHPRFQAMLQRVGVTWE